MELKLNSCIQNVSSCILASLSISKVTHQLNSLLASLLELTDLRRPRGKLINLLSKFIHRSLTLFARLLSDNLPLITHIVVVESTEFFDLPFEVGGQTLDELSLK